MPFQPSRLSVRFEPAAGALLDRAVRNVRRKGHPWAVGIIESQPGEPREATPLGLSVSEREFQRALYRDPRIHHPDPRRHPDAAWSLKQPAWGEVIGGRRFVRIRVFADTSGARRARREPGTSYVRHPSLRSIAAVTRLEDQG